MSTSTEASRDRTPPSEDLPFVRWHRRILGFCMVIFAFELGVFLVVFPWLRNWEQSWIPVHSPQLAPVWMSHYFRGALSGVGLLDIYLALTELIKQVGQTFRRSPL